MYEQDILCGISKDTLYNTAIQNPVSHEKHFITHIQQQPRYKCNANTRNLLPVSV